MVILASGIARERVRGRRNYPTRRPYSTQDIDREMQPYFIAHFLDIGHPCYGQLTPVKRRYLLTVSRPYGGCKLKLKYPVFLSWNLVYVMWTCCKQAQDQKFKLPRYQAERFHEIASECTSQFNVSRRSGCFFPKIHLFQHLKWTNWSLQLANETTIQSLLVWATGTVKNFPLDQAKHVQKSMAALCQKTGLDCYGSFWPHRYSKSTTPKATQILLRIKNCKNEIKNWFFWLLNI